MEFAVSNRCLWVKCEIFIVNKKIWKLKTWQKSFRPCFLKITKFHFYSRFHTLLSIQHAKNVVNRNDQFWPSYLSNWLICQSNFWAMSLKLCNDHGLGVLCWVPNGGSVGAHIGSFETVKFWISQFFLHTDYVLWNFT